MAGIGANTCPSGTTACASLSAAQLVAAVPSDQDVVAVRMQVNGITRAGFSQTLRSAFRAQVAATAGVLPTAVELRYVADITEASARDGSFGVLSSLGGGTPVGIDVQVAITVPHAAVTVQAQAQGRPSSSQVAEALTAAIDDGTLKSGLSTAGVPAVDVTRERDVVVVDRAAVDKAGGQAAADSSGGSVLGVAVTSPVFIGAACAVVLTVAAAAVAVVRRRTTGGFLRRPTSSKVRIIPSGGVVTPRPARWSSRRIVDDSREHRTTIPGMM